MKLHKERSQRHPVQSNNIENGKKMKGSKTAKCSLWMNNSSTMPLRPDTLRRPDNSDHGRLVTRNTAPCDASVARYIWIIDEEHWGGILGPRMLFTPLSAGAVLSTEHSCWWESLFCCFGCCLRLCVVQWTELLLPILSGTDKSPQTLPWFN